jgi:hypothetical protein
MGHPNCDGNPNMKTIHPSRILKSALLFDALASGALALLHLLGNHVLSTRLALDSRLLLYTGIFLLGYTNLLLVLAHTDRIWLWLLKSIIAGNAVWAAGCLAVGALTMLSGRALLSPALAFLALQTAAVLVFACWEYAGLRRSAGKPRVDHGGRLFSNPL